MKLAVKPTAFLKGTVQLPASKSYSIRAAMIASCGGNSLIKNLSDCDDAVAALNVAKALGSKITPVSKNNFKVFARPQKKSIFKINVNESGTVLRFLLPLIGFHSSSAKIDGKGTLVGRPNAHLLRTLREMGMDIRGAGEKESVPIIFKGGSLSGGKVKIEGSLSSQFISALLIACPQIQKNTELNLTGTTLVSQDYITMTLQVLKKAGIKIQSKGARKFLIRGGQKFKGLNFTIPSDYGLSAFLMAAAALVPSNVNLTGHLDDNLIQADGHILTFLKKMGVKFAKTKTSIKMKGPFQLKGGHFSLKDCPDLLPIMAVLALFAKGTTRFYNIAHARAKESDRISDLRKELLKVGAKVQEKGNELWIYPQENYKNGVTLNPHRDHRLAMAFAVLGLKLAVNVEDIECTHKSYPKFVADFKKLGAKVI